MKTSMTMRGRSSMKQSLWSFNVPWFLLMMAFGCVIAISIGFGLCQDVPCRYDNNNPLITTQSQSSCRDQCFKCYSCCLSNCEGDTGSSKGSKTPCMTLTQAGQALWESDTNRFTQSEMTLDFQTKIQRGYTKDKAPNKLFSKVDESRFNTLTYKSFFKLLDNYDPIKGIAEVENAKERHEIDSFIDAVLDTKVMDVLFDYLQCQGSVTTKSDLKSILSKLWFQTYNRSPKYDDLDTSGFEHVMVGEYKSSHSVNGFHSWLSFYNEEKKGNLNYLGYIGQGDPNILVTAFTWNGHIKSLTSFFVGVSPEFDLALYTLCFLQGGQCHLVLGGHNVVVQTYNQDGHIATAFVKVKV